VEEKPTQTVVKYLAIMSSTLDLVQWKGTLEFNSALDR